MPSNNNSTAYGRSAARVRNVVYLTPKKATSGGFFLDSVNGAVNTSMGAGRASA